MKERWRTIDEYEGIYEVSNKGKVRSLDRKIYIERGTGFDYNIKGKIMAFEIDKDGYQRVPLTKNKKQTKYYIHRLVGFAFIPNPDNKPFINHINGIKDDNTVANLEWVTASENTLHAYDNDLAACQKGVSNNANVLKEKQVLKIKKYKKMGLKPTAISKKMGLVKSTVNNVYYGYSWGWLEDE